MSGTADTIGRRAWAGLLQAFDTMIPGACVGCRRGIDPAGAPLCSLCRARMPRLPRPRCDRCAEPLGNLPAARVDFGRCGTCEGWPDALQAADAPFVFDDLGAAVVRALKYQGWRSLVPYMVDEMLPAARRLTRGSTGHGRALLVVPVPLTRARRRERGFNQAEDLARGLSDRLQAPLRPLLIRDPGGTRQASLRGGLRRANVQGRFRTLGVCAAPAESVLVVDDVLTTGATAIACAETLAEAGFRHIATVSFARTLRPLDCGGVTGVVRPPKNRQRPFRPKRGSE